MTKLNKRPWNTYRPTCYTHDVAQDQRSAGGTHNRQVRWNGHQWQMRIRQSNGSHEAFSETWAVTDADGEAAFETAKTY